MIQGMMGMMFGMQVVVDPHLPRFKMTQFRFPRSKGKRVRLKWTKRQENFKQVPISTIYMFNGNTVVMHPDEFEKIKHTVREERMMGFTTYV